MLVVEELLKVARTPLTFLIDDLLTDIVVSRPGAKALDEPTASMHTPAKANTIMPSANGVIDSAKHKK